MTRIIYLLYALVSSFMNYHPKSLEDKPQVIEKALLLHILH